MTADNGGSFPNDVLGLYSVDMNFGTEVTYSFEICIWNFFSAES